MRQNRTFEWKFMTIWISRESLNWSSDLKVMTISISQELSLFNFDRLDILSTWIGPPSEKLWPFEFLEILRCWISSISIYYAPESDLREKSYDHYNLSESFRCSVSSVSIYYGSEWDMHVKSYDHLNFSRALVAQFRASRYIMRLNGTSVEKLWPFEFLKSFRCSLSIVSIYYAPESDIRVKSYDHLNFTRASVVQFWASLYVISLNRSSELKFMTISISQELPLFNFDRLDILCAWIGPMSEKFWPFEFPNSFRCSISSVSIYYAPESDLRVKSYDYLNFSRASVIQFRASLYVMRLNRSSELKVMTISLSQELPLFNFDRLDILYARMGPPLKSFDHLNLSRAFVVQFQASRYIMRLNRTSEWKVMTILISRELPLFNFERLDILWTWIRHPCEKLWPFEFLKSFRCSISSVSIYYAREWDLRWKVVTIWISQELSLFNFVRLDI